LSSDPDSHFFKLKAGLQMDDEWLNKIWYK
jgi:hypothetical protein